MAPSSSDSISERQEFLDWFYVGINMENILYGIELSLYLKTIRILLRNRAHKKSKTFYALFSSMMLFSITVWVATQAIFGEKMWLLDSDFPGGPTAYWRKYIAVWYMDWATTVIVVLQLMTDALMIYRCRIIWSNYRVVVVPMFLWLVTFVLGVIVDWKTSTPGGDYFTGVSAQLSLAYWSIAVFLNTILTCMICYRLVCHGRMVRKHLGHEYASLYFSVATIVVESALPYTLSGIAFLVSLGVESPKSVMFLNVYFMMMCISPQMLILRVVAGKAWRNDTSSRSDSAIKFGPTSLDKSGSPWLDNNGARANLQTLSNAYLSEGRGRVRTQEV